MTELKIDLLKEDMKELIKSFKYPLTINQQRILNRFSKTFDETKDYLKHSVSWGVEDFAFRAEQLEESNWKEIYDKNKFREALEKMIYNHDACNGINWDTIDFYLDEYCRIK